MLLRGQKKIGTEKRQSNNGAVIKQNPSFSSRDVHNLIWSLSSAGAKAPHRGGGWNFEVDYNFRFQSAKAWTLLTLATILW